MFHFSWRGVECLRRNLDPQLSAPKGGVALKSRDLFNINRLDYSC